MKSVLKRLVLAWSCIALALTVIPFLLLFKWGVSISSQPVVYLALPCFAIVLSLYCLRVAWVWLNTENETKANVIGTVAFFALFFSGINLAGAIEAILTWS